MKFHALEFLLSCPSDFPTRNAMQLPIIQGVIRMAEASNFFEGGSLGYSVTADSNRLDGLALKTNQWQVEPLQLRTVYSSYFSDEEKFPKGSVEFDHALIMRNVAHEWHNAEDLYI